MIEHHPDCQFILCLFQDFGIIVSTLEHPKFLELGEVFRYRVVQAHKSLLHQLCNRHAAETLGLGALHIHVIQANGPFSIHVGIAQASDFVHSVFIEYTDGSGQNAAVHIGLKGVLNEMCPRFGKCVLRAAAGQKGQKRQQEKREKCLFHIWSVISSASDKDSDYFPSTRI